MYSNRPLCVFTTRYSFAESANWSCNYACDKSSFEKEIPPDLAAKISSL